MLEAEWRPAATRSTSRKTFRSVSGVSLSPSPLRGQISHTCTYPVFPCFYFGGPYKQLFWLSPLVHPHYVLFSFFLPTPPLPIYNTLLIIPQVMTSPADDRIYTYQLRTKNPCRQRKRGISLRFPVHAL